jgi:hypothetical protein
MHDYPKALNPVYNDPLVLVVGVMGLWLTVMAGGGTIFAVTVSVLTSLA